MTTRFVDPAGRVLRTVSPLGQVTQFAYDNLNRVTSITDARGGQTSFTYDGNSNLLTLTDALSHTTTYTYDDMDRVVTRTDPLTRVETYTYDDNGNLETVTDRESQVTTHAYDSFDRRTLTTFDDSSTTAYAYDDGDRLIEIDDSIAGVIERDWDDLDRLTEERTPEGTVSYTYDDADRRATMTASGQSSVSYTYDNANRLTGITQSTASVGFDYDDANRRTSLTLPNGIVVTTSYDAGSQITGLSYDLGMTNLGTLTYVYDSGGNRVNVGGAWGRTGLPAAVASASYDAANQPTMWNGNSITYDDNGNLTNDGTDTYTWNARDQLIGVSGAASATFGYDGAGRRRMKTVGGTTTRFLYDGLNFVQEQNGVGSATANILGGLAIDETLRRTDSSGARDFLTDALGTTLALTDSSGSLQTEYSYEPFGRSTATGASSSNSALFTGREEDTATLNYLRARFSHSGLSRFIAEDPLEFGGGDVNLHVYASDSPLNWIDPLGLRTSMVAPPGSACNRKNPWAMALTCNPVLAAGIGPLLGVFASAGAGAAGAAGAGDGAASAAAGEGSGESAGARAVKSLSKKIQRDLGKRGWTRESIEEAIDRGRSVDAPNKPNPGNGATRYIHPETGKSVVVDNTTGEVIHIGGPGFGY
ncbi:MAG TPA: RHS repeat-associated core domain-containing protein [Vicinamibacterales bacterium]|nr:RHS repeat-associated core domain-containing protein [Vicinamibacterales bacterium]